MIPSQKVFISILFAVSFLSAADTCALSGTVVNELTGEPIPRATLSGSGTPSRADSQGRWSIASPCGAIGLTAQRPGFMQPAPIPVSLTRGESKTDLVIKLTPQAVIAGSVSDDAGDPVMSGQITLFHGTISNGRFAWQQSGGTQTNDLGEYRIPSLSAGRYLVCVNGFRCFPGPPDGNRAGGLVLSPGREARANLILPDIRTAHIRGSVSGVPAGSRLSVVAFPGAASSAGLGQVQAQVRPDSTFDIPGVRPGSWIVFADYFDSGKRLTARTPVEVMSADVDGIIVSVEALGSIRGIVRASDPATALPPLGFVLRPLEPRVTVGPPRWEPENRSFSMSDLMSGKFRVEIVNPKGIYVASALLNGEEVLGRDVAISQQSNTLEFVLGNDGGSLTGSVAAEVSPAPRGSAVLIVPGHGQAQLVPILGGQFSAKDLAPGTYSVSAWDRPNEIEYTNADWMSRNARQTSVTITAGQRTTVSLTLQTTPPI